MASSIDTKTSIDTKVSRDVVNKHFEQYKNSWSIILCELDSKNWKWSLYHGSDIKFHGTQLSAPAAFTCAYDKFCVETGIGDILVTQIVPRVANCASVGPRGIKCGLPKGHLGVHGNGPGVRTWD